jgi:hypothetical protein
VCRGSAPQNYAALYNDIHAAYQNAPRYHVSGEEAHADTAVAILNAWSEKLTSIQSSADRFLAAGQYGHIAIHDLRSAGTLPGAGSGLGSRVPYSLSPRSSGVRGAVDFSGS